LGLVSVLPAFAGAPSPRALCKALLASPIPQAQLPKGSDATKPIAHPATRVGRRHHYVGAVGIIVSRGSSEMGSIYYQVFTRHDAALRSFKKVGRTKGVTIGHLRGFPQPAVILNGTGSTHVFFVRGVVEVAATAAGRHHGRRADALGLAGVALRHLKAVEQRIAR
jgi:hypothetical protein